MKITDVQAIILRQDKIEMKADGSQDALIIKVYTDQGIIGIGEVDSSPYIIKSIVDSPSSHSYSRGLKDILIGENPLEIDRLWQKMYKLSLYYGKRGAAIHAISGIDIALWDIAGKYYNQPIYILLGAKYKDQVEAYASVLMPDTIEEINKIVDYFLNLGYKGIKFGWGSLGKSKESDIALVKAARKAMGNSMHLAIDIGFCYDDLNYAITMAKEFEEFNLFWLEEPFMPDNIDGYIKLRSNTNLKIAAGEQLTTWHEFTEFIEKGCIDIIQPDISRCGGISEARKIALIAKKHNVNLVPHQFSTEILISASLHLLASLPNENLMEFCRSGNPLNTDLLLNPIQFKNGFLKIPEGPGLGIEINDKIVEKYKVN